MKNNLGRALAVLATVTAVTLSGVGVASAGGPGGSGSSSTTSAAASVQTLREQLKTRADSGDVAGARTSLGDLDPLLTDLARGERYTIQATAQNTAVTAKQENTKAEQGVDELATQLKSRQALPPVTDLLNALLQRLLLTLSSLVNDLLGGPHIIPAP
ncbi:hypothetical protein ACWEOE_17665 [Amycolatopsis sp. NPDC004368]